MAQRKSQSIAFSLNKSSKEQPQINPTHPRTFHNPGANAKTLSLAAQPLLYINFDSHGCQSRSLAAAFVRARACGGTGGIDCARWHSTGAIPTDVVAMVLLAVMHRGGELSGGPLPG